jgi:hypothetical protein
MSTAAERARAKAARLAATSRPGPATSDDDERRQTRSALTRAARSETIKTSLHLAPELHLQFTAWCLEAARELQRGRVNGSDVMRILVRRLLVDEELQKSVIEQLRR